VVPPQSFRDWWQQRESGDDGTKGGTR
jgi:hypothetical protein